MPGAAPCAGGSDRGATPPPDYVHPERAFYIFGPEDGTLEPARFAAVKEAHLCAKPRARMNSGTPRSTSSLYDRLAKTLQSQRRAEAEIIGGPMTASGPTARAVACSPAPPVP